MALNGRHYFSYGTQAVASPTDTAWSNSGATTVRPCIYDILFSCQATPADNSIQWDIQRCTAQGTATAFTPIALDHADPASLSATNSDHTIEPTYTAAALVFHMALNQRATHRWIADPNGPIVTPATASNGVGIAPVHASFTGVTDVMVHYYE